MTAFMDAMIFLIVIMIAIGTTAHYMGSDHEIMDPDQFLRQLSGIEVRLSDFTDLEDDSLVFLSDVMAYSVDNDSSVGMYLECLLSDIFGEYRFLLTYTYGDSIVEVGYMHDYYRSKAYLDIPVSIGGRINISLSIL
ncbi:MAG: hypothetical protein IKP04_05805 [Candidatus Methanomethylophilaceae archaeon]|nr:hypothetical protein [Candidatus Methanomethylophilaceae archaeon]